MPRAPHALPGPTRTHLLQLAPPLLLTPPVIEPTLPEQEARQARPNTGSPASEPQVMVVDDDPSVCDFLRSFLAARGYQAITLVNAEDAVRRYQAERPATVILDVVMPGAMTASRRSQRSRGSIARCQ